MIPRLSLAFTNFVETILSRNSEKGSAACVLRECRRWGALSAQSSLMCVCIYIYRGAKRDFSGAQNAEKENVKKEHLMVPDRFLETILQNTVKHRKFPQTVLQNASFSETVLN